MSRFSWRRAWPAYVASSILAALMIGTVAFALAIHWHISIAQGLVLACVAQLIASLTCVVLDSTRKARNS